VSIDVAESLFHIVILMTNSAHWKSNILSGSRLGCGRRDAKDAYWSEQVDIQRQVATAWVLYAEGKQDDALNAMSAAADSEDKTEKHPVTPGVPKPARELYGVMLLESGNAKDAVAAFEATLKKEPNRLGAYVGAAKAAEKSGESARAQEYYGKVVSIADDADDSRTEVADARAFLMKALRSVRRQAWEHIVRAFFLPIVLCALATPAGAQSLQVIGYSGYLGEWELTATVTENVSGHTKEYSGPLTMKHVGVCAQNGPEEKTGKCVFRYRPHPPN
jgi:tetratricopeptide (TPR) repeat protein